MGFSAAFGSHIDIKKQVDLEPSVNTSYFDRVTEEFILLVRKG